MRPPRGRGVRRREEGSGGRMEKHNSGVGVQTFQGIGFEKIKGFVEKIEGFGCAGGRA